VHYNVTLRWANKTFSGHDETDTEVVVVAVGIIIISSSSSSSSIFNVA